MGHKVKQSLVNSRIDFFYYAFRNVLLVSIPLLIFSVLILGLNVSHSSAAELSSADSVNISIPTSCTLVSDINNAHNASIINGRYVSDIGKTTITTYCNDENGYVVYASGFSNNELGNNKLISDRSTSTNNYDISTGTATSGPTSAWAMKLSTTNVGNLGGETGEEYGYITNNDGNIVQTNQGSDTPSIIPPYHEYSAIPNGWTPVVSKPSGTVASTTGSSFSTTYAAYISTTQPSGSYTGQVRYLIAHPYTGPSVLYMQDVANWKDTLNVGDTALALDRRDYKTYWVTKLLDGHIWMTQNLAIDLGEIDIAGNVTPRIFTSEDTDLNTIYDETTGSYAEYDDGYSYDSASDIISWTPADSAATSKFKGDTVAEWSNSTTIPYSAIKTDSSDTGHEALGNYYNWTAAIASNDSSSLASDTKGNISNNPQNSICPKGWRLPTISNQSNAMSGSTNEFARLNYIYNDNKTSGTGSGAKLTESPLVFKRSGRVGGGSLTNLGSYGHYWSSTLYGIEHSYYLYFDINGVFPANDGRYGGGGRSDGKSIRCVAR